MHTLATETLQNRTKRKSITNRKRKMFRRALKEPQIESYMEIWYKTGKRMESFWEFFRWIVFAISYKKIYNFILSCFFEEQKRRIDSQKIYGENLCLFVRIDITLQSNLNWKRFLQIGNSSLRFFEGKVAFLGFFKVNWGGFI